MQRNILIGLVLTLFIVIFIPIYWATESGRHEAASQRFKAESIHRGAELYSENCVTCHGPAGEGKIGPALKGTTLDEEDIARIITAGVSGTAMPAMGEAEGGPLSPHQIEDLVTFIENWDQSLLKAAQTPSPEPASGQPPVRASPVTAGKQLYQTYCASCHGANGAGGIKIGEATSPDIRFAALNDLYNGDWSLAKRATFDGKDEEGEDLDAAMPRWRGKLSDTQLDNIIAYLQTLP